MDITTDDYLRNIPEEWQRANLTAFKALVHECVPSISEEIKWNVPVFMLDGKMVFSMASFKAHTKYNFIGNGALLDDPYSLFNNGLDSQKSRSIDLKEHEQIDKDHLQQLVQQAIDTL